MKGANYSWMVCKGRKVVAMTTTQREAEAEAARVGGQVHPMPHKNPADPKFSHRLGGGVFSTAYGADDPDPERMFYAPKGTDLDRLNYGVQSVSKYMDKGLQGARDVVDIAKTIIAMARIELNNAPGGPDKAALAFLPSIRPVRMDRNNQGELELIYKMPVYKVWEKGGKNLANHFARAVYPVLSPGGSLSQWVPRLQRFLQQAQDPTSRWYDPAAVRWDGYVEALIRVTKTLDSIVKSLPIGLTGLDLHEGNAAVDKRGHLILLDPIVAEMKEADAVKLWQQLDWTTHPKVVQRGGKAKGKKKVIK